jgi:hypothetical protein
MDRREFLLVGAGVPLGLAFGTRALAAPAGDGPLAFVTADLESHVAVFDPAEARLVARIRTLPGPRSIENVDGATALVAHTALGRLSLVDGVGRRVRAVVEGFRTPRYTAGYGSLAYVTDSARGEIVTIDVTRGVVIARTAVPGPARHVTITPDGDTIWTALGSKAQQLAVLDVRKPQRPRLKRTITPPFLAHDVVAAPNGEHLWVTAGDSLRIAVYERNGQRPLEILSAGRAPQHVAFVRNRAFVASGDDGTVRIHRLNGDLLGEAEVPVGSYNVTAFSVGSAVTPSLSRGTVAVLDDRGHVRAVRKVARVAHDVCLLTAF